MAHFRYLVSDERRERFCPAADTGTFNAGNGEALCKLSVKRCNDAASKILTFGPSQFTQVLACGDALWLVAL